MHTFGSVILGIFGVTLLNVLLSIISGLLGSQIVTSTGLAWLPILLNAAFIGSAVYGGLFFALALVPKASIRITCVIVAILFTIQSVFNLVNYGADNIIVTIIIILNAIAVVIGALAAGAGVAGFRAENNI